MSVQAIVTKYRGPTDVRGARVKAIAQAGSVTLSWDNNLNPDENHCAAAKALAAKFNWLGVYHGGGMPDGDMVWVAAADMSRRRGRDFFVASKVHDFAAFLATHRGPLAIDDPEFIAHLIDEMGCTREDAIDYARDAGTAVHLYALPDVPLVWVIENAHGFMWLDDGPTGACETTLAAAEQRLFDEMTG